jgi:hypothetical protein
MVKNVLLGFASLAMVVASAASSYNVTFYQPVMVNASELKPGDYKLELKDKTVVIKQGKSITEAPVTVATDNQKYQRTAVRLNALPWPPEKAAVHQLPPLFIRARFIRAKPRAVK